MIVSALIFLITADNLSGHLLSVLVSEDFQIACHLLQHFLANRPPVDLLWVRLKLADFALAMPGRSFRRLGPLV